MICAESVRSSAVSTAVTSALESVSPHGVWRPKDLRYQSLKSASPDLWLRLPVVVVDPVAREAAVRRSSAPCALPSAWIVSDSVVHTSGACHCTNGRRRTRRGAGTPVRPPAVCVKRTQPSPLTGLRRDVGQADRLERARHRAELDGRRAHQPAAALPEVGDAPLVVDLDPGLEDVGEAEAVGVAQRLAGPRSLPAAASS